MRTSWVLAIVTGCSFHHGAAPSSSPDGGGTIDALARQICFGASTSSLFTVCYPSDQQPTGTFTIDTQKSLDTGAGCSTVMTANGVEACVIAAQQVEIDAVYTVVGSRPLVLLATQTLTIGAGGVVDVSSNHVDDGANNDATTCNPMGDGMSGASGGGGGAGGSFGSAGGGGGAGNASPVTIGVAAAITVPVTLRGGCRGGAGGDGNSDNNGGSGGKAGGGLDLIAGVEIVIKGKVYASGAAGRGGETTAGGGGGGSGGLISLDAPKITLDSGTAIQPVIATNGGGGGGGGGGNGNGFDGFDGTLVSTPGAAGGAPGVISPAGGGGGVGTNWSSVTGGDGHAGASGAGGGGGGGGYGIISVVGMYDNVNADVSPEYPTLH